MWVLAQSIRTYSGNDVRYPHENEEDVMGDNIRVGNDETESNGRRYRDTMPYFAATMRSLRVEMQSYRANNEKLVQAQEDQYQLNAAMLKILKDLQINMDSGHGRVNPEGSKNNTGRRKRTSSGSSDSE